MSQNQINISRTFLSMIDRVDTNCSKTIATVSGKDSNSVNKDKDCKEWEMCKEKYGVEIKSAFLLGTWFGARLLGQPPHVDEDEHVEEEGDEDEDETSENPDCKCCQPFWLRWGVGQDIGEHGHKNLKKIGRKSDKH